MFHGSATNESGDDAGRLVSKRSLACSVALHCALVLAIFVAGVVPFKSRKDQPKDLMVEFTVAVPQQPEEEKDEKPPETPPEEKSEPEPEPPPPEKEPDAIPPEKPPKPKFEKGKIVRREAPKPERKIVEKPKKQPEKKPVAVQPRKIEVKGPKLSDAEIRKLLEQGAKPSDHTSIPASERERCLALIDNAIRRAWICPDSSALSGVEPEIEFTIGLGGALGNVRLVRSSGNALLDQSVVNAAKAVRSVSGLSAGFIRSNPRLTVAFSLEGV